MKVKGISILIWCLYSGCMGFDTKVKLVGNYYLVAPDDASQLSLDYCDPNDLNGCGGVIQSTVFAIGYNKEFIIVKQHPNNTINITNHFILLINDNAEPNKKDLLGPLTLEQFNEKRKELKIPDSLKFTTIK